MNQRQMNFFNMAKATVELMTSNSAVWEQEPVIARGMAKLGNLCADVEQEASAQHKNETKGRTANRNMERTKLEACMYTICGRILLCASDKEDMQTARLVTYSHSQLSHLPLEKLLTAVRAVASRAEEVIDDLKPYRVTQEDINQLMQLADITAQLNAHRDAVKGEHTGNTMNLARLFTQLRTLLKQMDKNVEVYLTDENLIQAYFLTRRIIDRKGGGSSKKTEGEV